jgi:hypothetical protein
MAVNDFLDDPDPCCHREILKDNLRADPANGCVADPFQTPQETL